jgi:DNA-binding XRE family transcriptional regulator
MFRPVEFTEKLRRCAASINKAKAGKAAGLSPTTISNYIAKGSIPRADIAMKMARALGVPLEWFVDDSQGWPPPSGPNASMTTEQLAGELGRRMVPVGVVMLGKIHEAQRVDWAAVAGELMDADPKSPLPARLRRLVELPSQINALASELLRYEPVALVGDTAPPEVLRDVKPGFEVGLIDLRTWQRNLEDKPGYRAASELGGLWLVPEEWRRPPSFAEHVKYLRERAAADLKGAGLRPKRKKGE